MDFFQTHVRQRDASGEVDSVQCGRFLQETSAGHDAADRALTIFAQFLRIDLKYGAICENAKAGIALRMEHSLCLNIRKAMETDSSDGVNGQRSNVRRSGQEVEDERLGQLASRKVKLQLVSITCFRDFYGGIRLYVCVSELCFTVFQRLYFRDGLLTQDAVFSDKFPGEWSADLASRGLLCRKMRDRLPSRT